MMRKEAGGAVHRILVVDDHSDTIEALSVLFSALGYEMRGELRGDAALRAAREFDPQLILLDIGLPDVSGYQLVQAMRADPDLRDRFIVAVTGYGQPQDVAQAYEAGFDRHIVKPLDMSRLRGLVRIASAAGGDAMRDDARGLHTDSPCTVNRTAQA